MAELTVHTPCAGRRGRCAQAARTYCREIFEVLRTLKGTRDMSVNEVKLVVSIEDPRTKVRPEETHQPSGWLRLRIAN